MNVNSSGSDPSKTKRVLFVDDDAHVLDGYRRLFRSMRNSWQMTFANSGEEAVSLIQQQNFEVLVTDLQMPGMNGVELLEQVIELNPGIARLVLTGYSDAASSIAASELAHQCLSKPCDVELLREAIDHACHIQAIIGSERIKRVIGSVRRLPSAPDLYHQLNRELARESATAASVSAILERDIGLSAKLLQLVNSSFFGLRKRVVSLEQAVALLGVRRLRDVVLASHVYDSFPALPEDVQFSFEGLRQQSVIVARLARKIAQDIGLESDLCDQAFLGGLLHDFGILLLASNWPDRYANLLKGARAKNAPLYLAEKAYLKLDHAEAGAYILGLWKIPPGIVEAVLCHHRAIESSSSPIVVAVHAADGLVHQLLEDAPGVNTGQVNEQYIAGAGFVERLPAWRVWCQEIADEVISSAE